MYHVLKQNTALWLAIRFTRLYLWLTRASGIQCRGCGMNVPVDDVVRFVNEGCLSCGGYKLTGVNDG